MYDNIILKHYADVASNEGHLESCTMVDNKIRKIETKFIIDCVKKYRKTYPVVDSKKSITLLDVGCGNGYTLSQLYKEFPDISIKGIEFTPELRELANNKGLPCYIEPGDVRKKESLPCGIDIIISQRVIINLLDELDQKYAVENMLDCVNRGGYLIFLEAFQSGLNTLNLCRSELGLSQIPPAHHNLYLKDSFFDQFDAIEEIETEYGPHILSTHYFISRVLHDLALAATSSKYSRNSLFVHFFDELLPLGIGRFSPIKCLLFRKI